MVSRASSAEASPQAIRKKEKKSRHRRLAAKKVVKGGAYPLSYTTSPTRHANNEASTSPASKKQREIPLGDLLAYVPANEYVATPKSDGSTATAQQEKAKRVELEAELAKEKAERAQEKAEHAQERAELKTKIKKLKDANKKRIAKYRKLAQDRGELFLDSMDRNRKLRTKLGELYPTMRPAVKRNDVIIVLLRDNLYEHVAASKMDYELNEQLKVHPLSRVGKTWCSYGRKDYQEIWDSCRAHGDWTLQTDRYTLRLLRAL